MGKETAEKGAERLLTASQAQGIARECCISDIDSILDNILDEAKKGGQSIKVYKPILNEVIAKLEELGYHIPELRKECKECVEDGLMHVIRW